MERDKLRSSSNLNHDDEIKEETDNKDKEKQTRPLLDEDKEEEKEHPSTSASTPITLPTKVSADDLDKAEHIYDATMNKWMFLFQKLIDAKKQGITDEKYIVQLKEHLDSAHIEVTGARDHVHRIKEQIMIGGDGTGNAHTLTVVKWWRSLFGYLLLSPSSYSTAAMLKVLSEKSLPSSSSSSPSIGSSLKSSSNTPDKIKKYHAKRDNDTKKNEDIILTDKGNNPNVRHRSKHFDDESNDTNMKE